MRRALPEADVIVHVEPQPPEEAEVRERAQEAALRVPDVREVHNVNVLTVGRTDGDLAPPEAAGRRCALDEAHAVAEQVERDDSAVPCPRSSAVRTHLEPLAETSEGWRPSGWRGRGAHGGSRSAIVTEELGAPPRALRVLRDRMTASSLFLTLALDPHTELADAHATRERRSRSGSAASARTIADVHRAHGAVGS